MLASTRSRNPGGAASAGAEENSGMTAHLRLVSAQISHSSTCPATRANAGKAKPSYAAFKKL